MIMSLVVQQRARVRVCVCVCVCICVCVNVSVNVSSCVGIQTSVDPILLQVVCRCSCWTYTIGSNEI